MLLCADCFCLVLAGFMFLLILTGFVDVCSLDLAGLGLPGEGFLPKGASRSLTIQFGGLPGF